MFFRVTVSERENEKPIMRRINFADGPAPHIGQSQALFIREDHIAFRHNHAHGDSFVIHGNTAS